MAHFGSSLDLKPFDSSLESLKSSAPVFRRQLSVDPLDGGLEVLAQAHFRGVHLAPKAAACGLYRPETPRFPPPELFSGPSQGRLGLRCSLCTRPGPSAPPRHINGSTSVSTPRCRRPTPRPPDLKSQIESTSGIQSRIENDIKRLKTIIEMIEILEMIFTLNDFQWYSIIFHDTHLSLPCSLR